MDEIVLFQSTSSIQRKTISIIELIGGFAFQSTSSIQRKTFMVDRRPLKSCISIHFLYTEEDTEEGYTPDALVTFQSTSSIQRKTLNLSFRNSFRQFQSTSSIQRKTRDPFSSFILADISIHFLYTEEDLIVWTIKCNLSNFNPLPLYRGRLPAYWPKPSIYIFQSTSSIQRKTCWLCPKIIWWWFQSTSSIQRKTRLVYFFYFFDIFQYNYSIQSKTHRIVTKKGGPNFNPLPLYRGRRKPRRLIAQLFSISIHFLYTEEDSHDNMFCGLSDISIHFLYTEEDGCFEYEYNHKKVFQSTSSIQRKTGIDVKKGKIWVFQSTSSIQRKTPASFRCSTLLQFQSTSSIQRKTFKVYEIILVVLFQSTSSIQRKTSLAKAVAESLNISIHFLYTEEDLRPHRISASENYFNPLPLYRGRQVQTLSNTIHKYFNPLPLYRGRRPIIHHFGRGIYFNPLPLYRGRQ